MVRLKVSVWSSAGEKEKEKEKRRRSHTAGIIREQARECGRRRIDSVKVEDVLIRQKDHGNGETGDITERGGDR